MTQHPRAVADHGRRQHRTATELRDLIRHIFPRHDLGSRVVNKCTVLFKTMCGVYGRALDATSPGDDSTAWNTVDDQTVETPRTLHVVRAMRGILRRSVLGITDVDPHGTIRGHPACMATTGATKDEQEEQCCESSGGSVGARKSLTERQPGNLVEEGAERLRSSTDCDPEGRQRCDVLRTMRDVWESVAAHSPTRQHDDAGHAAAEPLLGMLDVQYNLRTQSGRVRCSTCGPEELRGCRRERGSHWGRRDTVLPKVQGQLKSVDPEVCLQLIDASGQPPENQMTTLGLVPRQKSGIGRTSDGVFQHS